MSYILVTPVLNEAGYLPQLRETILNQTVRPVLWVIGDGGSTDNSFEIATGLFRGLDWVRVIRQKHFSGDGYSHKNFALNVNGCMEHARKVCAEGNIAYSFVGKTDATPVLAKDYFETLLNEMAACPGIAYACGTQYMLSGRNRDQEDKKGVPGKIVNGYNDIRLYRREFIEGMGGYPAFFAPDTVLMIKALNRGWKISKVSGTHFVKSRANGSKIGFWKGYRMKGAGMYKLGYHPILIFLSAAYFSKSYPFYHGIAVLYGYFTAFARGEERINDSEVIRYFWRDRLLQVMKGKLMEG